jgi:hypothetical protein
MKSVNYFQKEEGGMRRRDRGSEFNWDALYACMELSQ